MWHPTAWSRRATLRLSVAEGMLHAVMLGASESYLGTLAVELGHRDRALALLATVPLLAGAVSQFAAAPLTAWLGTRRRVAVAGAGLQALAVFGFWALAVTGERSLAPFLAIKTLFWTAGSVMMPAWGAWIAELTRDTTRSRYFARRSAFVSAALVVAFVAGGAWLHGSGQPALRAYGDLFVVAFVARFLSAASFTMHMEPIERERGLRLQPPLAHVIAESRWRTVLYMSALMFASHVSVPFFTPYMLRELRMGYTDFAGVLSMAIIAKTVVFPLCHPLAMRIGLPRLLLLAGLGVGVTPTLWYLAGSVRALFFVELFTGCAWAAWEYATFQLQLASSSTEHRLRFLSIAGTLTATAQLAGALAGTLLLEQLALDYRSVFLVSSALRLTSLAVLLLDLRRVLPAVPGLRRLAVRLVSVRPNAGVALRLIDSEEPPESKNGRAR